MDREESLHLVVVILFISGPVELLPRRASGTWGRSPNYHMHILSAGQLEGGLDQFHGFWQGGILAAKAARKCRRPAPHFKHPVLRRKNRELRSRVKAQVTHAPSLNTTLPLPGWVGG